jgi:hypothetical protein
MTKRSTKKQKKFPLPRSLRRMYPNVKFAVDADKTVEVSVDPKDCKDAVKLDPTNCALARAAKRETHADGVIIGLSSSYIIKGDHAIRFATPERVQREIVSFDRHHDFAPGNYTLVPKAPTAKFGSGKENRRRWKDKRDHGRNKSGTRRALPSARVRVLPKGQQFEE